MSTRSSAVAKPQYRLFVVSGPDKGVAYDLTSNQIRIGRETDNDIIIAEDPKLSRHHALVEIVGDQVEVVDLSQKNKITVNNQRTERISLKEGMSFTVGMTEMRLERINSMIELTSSQPMTSFARAEPTVVPPSFAQPQRPHLSQVPHIPPYVGPHYPPQMPRTRRRPDNTVTYILIGVVVVIGFMFYNTGRSRHMKDDLRTTDQVDSTIKESQETKEKLRQRAEKLGGNFQDAQSLYVQGFRDYKKGQYGRAIEAFRGALAIYPEHQLAQRYVKLAHRRLDELIQFNMVQGRQYRSREMYEKCAASFSNVLNLSPDKRSPTYKEAKELREECALQAEGRY